MSDRVVVSVSMPREAYDAISAAAARAQMSVSVFIRKAAVGIADAMNTRAFWDAGMPPVFQDFIPPGKVVSVSGSPGVMVSAPAGWSDTTSEVKVHELP